MLSALKHNPNPAKRRRGTHDQEVILLLTTTPLPIATTNCRRVSLPLKENNPFDDIPLSFRLRESRERCLDYRTARSPVQLSLIATWEY